MPTLRTSVRAGSYHDSVVLMRLQRALAAREGVLDAGVVMATPANLEILAASGLLDESPEVTAASAGDLLIAVRAESDEIAAEALAQVDALLSARVASGNVGYRPKSLDGAVRQLSDARWVAISVPGRFAAHVADQALDHLLLLPRGRVLVVDLHRDSLCTVVCGPHLSLSAHAQQLVGD